MDSDKMKDSIINPTEHENLNVFQYVMVLVCLRKHRSREITRIPKTLGRYNNAPKHRVKEDNDSSKVNTTNK